MRIKAALIALLIVLVAPCVAARAQTDQPLFESANTLHDAVVPEDGGFLLTGTTPEGTAWAERLGEDGEALWQRTPLRSVDGAIEMVATLPEGDFALLHTREEGEERERILMRMNSRGEMVVKIDLPEGTDSLLALEDGFLAFGAYTGADGGYILRLTRMDFSGKTIWQRDYSASLMEWNLTSAAHAGDRLLLTGMWRNAESGDYCGGLLCMDAQGNALWNCLFADSGFSVMEAVTATPDGGAAAVGWIFEPGGAMRGLAARVDRDGAILWRREYPLAEGSSFSSVLEMDDALLIAQTREGEGTGEGALLLIGEGGETLAERRDMPMDGRLLRDEDGALWMAGMRAEGEQWRTVLERAEVPVESEEAIQSATLEAEWLGTTEALAFVLDDARVLEALSVLLAERHPAEAPPDLTANGMRRFALRTADGETFELYWSSWRFDRTFLRGADGFFSLDHSVGAYLLALCRALESGAYTPQIDPTHAAFLAEYGWAIDYRIGQAVETLPARFVCRADDETSYYWTFHALLARDAGFDLSAFGGRTVTVTLYNARALTPERYPRVESPRAVVISLEGEIVGAYLSQGYDAKRAWSLRGNGYRELLGPKRLSDWFLEHTEKTARAEAIAAMEPDAVLRAYLTAQIEGDTETLLACQPCARTLDAMLANCGGAALYQKGTAREGDAIAEILSIEPYAEAERERVYVATWRVRENAFDPEEGDTVTRYAMLVKEAGGWKVDGFTTGL